MQIKNILIFDSTNAADGAWIDISNLVAFSVYIVNAEGKVWIEVSNDPNVNFDGAAIGAPVSAPTLVAANATPANANLVNQGTYFVKTTYITPWGETVASSESSLAVPDGKVLQVIAPPPLKTAIGYNVYVGKSTGTEVLQTMPQFAAQRVIDTGGIHWATAGAMPLNQNFFLVNGFQQTEVAPPISDLSGGVNSGLNISGNLPGSPATNDEIAIIVSGSTVSVNPSCLVWKWLRVRKDTTAQTIETQAWIMGQNG